MSEQQLLPTSIKDESITSKLLKLVPRKIEDNYEKIKARRQKLIDLMIKESGHSIDRVTAEKILDNIINYSRKFSVDPILVLAVIWKESHFNPNAKNGNFIWLMQINYSAHKDSLKSAGIESIEELLDVEKNISFGVAMLRGAFNKTTSRQQALMLYNRGNSARKYALKVLELYTRLMQILNR